MSNENINNNKRVNRFIKKIKDKDGNYFYFPVAHLYTVASVSDTDEINNNQIKLYMSMDNTCKTAEALRNTFGFFSTDSTGGKKEEVLNNSQKKLSEEADQAKNFNIKYGFISKDDYNNLHENHEPLTRLTSKAGEMFNSLCPDAEILSLNFVGKADRDADDCFYVSPNKNNKKTCLLEKLVDLLGPQAKKIGFLSKYKRYIDSRPCEEKYLPVLLPEVRKRVSEPSDWRNVLEGAGIYEYHNELVEGDYDGSIHGDFTDAGEKITKNLLNLLMKGRCEFKNYEYNDGGEKDEDGNIKFKKKNGFKVSLSKIKNLFYDKINQSGFFVEWNKIIDSKAEGLIERNELCEKIKAFEQKILNIDFDGMKLDHQSLIEIIDKMYDLYGRYNYKDAFLHNDTQDSYLSCQILNLLVHKYFYGIKDEIIEFGSGSQTNKFDSIHYIQALSYSVLTDLYKKLLLAKEKSQDELDKKIMELSSKLENLGKFLEAIINGGQDFENLLEQAKKYKGPIFDFIRQKIIEIYYNQLDVKDLEEIIKATNIISESLSNEFWAHVTQVNLNLEHKNKKAKDALKNGFITKDGDFVIPFVNLYNASYSTVEKRNFIDHNNNLKCYLHVEKKNLIEKTDKDNKNIVELKKIINEIGDGAVIEDVSMDEVDELINRQSNLLYDGEINKPEINNFSRKTLSPEKKFEAIINMFKKSTDDNKKLLENKTLKDMINKDEIQKSIVEYFDKLANETKSITEKKKTSEQDKKDLENKTGVLKNFIGNYIEFSNAPENQKEYLKKQLKDADPYTIAVLWEVIKNLFYLRAISFDTAKKIRLTKNVSDIFSKLKNFKPTGVKDKEKDNGPNLT